MKCYRIHTENKDAKWIERLLAIGFDGFTILKGRGSFKSAKESGLEIVIYTNNERLIKGIARQIKWHNNQDEILITETNCKLVTI